jgi:hypothetical protein
MAGVVRGSASLSLYQGLQEFAGRLDRAPPRLQVCDKAHESEKAGNLGASPGPDPPGAPRGALLEIGHSIKIINNSAACP